jgi:hypothetical protein
MGRGDSRRLDGDDFREVSEGVVAHECAAEHDQGVGNDRLALRLVVAAKEQGKLERAGRVRRRRGRFVLVDVGGRFGEPEAMKESAEGGEGRQQHPQVRRRFDAYVQSGKSQAAADQEMMKIRRGVSHLPAERFDAARIPRRLDEDVALLPVVRTLKADRHVFQREGGFAS